MFPFCSRGRVCACINLEQIMTQRETDWCDDEKNSSYLYSQCISQIYPYKGQLSLVFPPVACCTTTLQMDLHPCVHTVYVSKGLSLFAL